MRLSELRAREPFDGLLERTLSLGWSAQFERDYSVSTRGQPNGQLWLVQPLVSLYYVRDTVPEARLFMADWFRHTERAWLAIPQWLLGTMLSTRIALAHCASQGFSVSPKVPESEWKLVFPGNQRVRVFDFKAGRVRVMLKENFDVRTMRNEIDVRSKSGPGPFIPISVSDPQGRWFEEALIRGFSLARCPSWKNRLAFEASAFFALEVWQNSEPPQESGSDRALVLRDELQTLVDQVDARYGTRMVSTVMSWVHTLAGVCKGFSDGQLARSHGDFQPGNVMVDRTDHVVLVDWEHAGLRFRHYDAMVYGLRTRMARALGERLVRYLQTGQMGVPDGVLPQSKRRDWRRKATAMLLLEDLRFYLKESLTGPYKRPSPTLIRVMAELGPVGGTLWDLLA